jgi:molybdopterin-guanine dinucleotide biosynthesis protein A
MAEAATLLLLAGGESRRMGRPKALLPVFGTTLIEWMARRLATGFEHLLVSASGEEQLPEGLREHLVRDLRRGGGPLAGIESGLAACRNEVLVAVACDMPRVDGRRPPARRTAGRRPGRFRGASTPAS